jgi:hypothetical protein
MNKPKGTQEKTNKKSKRNNKEETSTPKNSFAQPLDFLLNSSLPIKKLATNSKKKNKNERIIDEIIILGIAINTKKMFSKRVYSVSGSLNGALKYPKSMKKIKIKVIRIKKTEKFRIKQDFDQEREYFSEIHFLNGENILNKTNPINEAKINNFIKSKIVPKIILKSMQN